MARRTDFAAGLLIVALTVPAGTAGQNPASTSAFQPGQTFLYSVHFHETTKVKPDSSASLSTLKSAVIDSRALIKVEVLSVDGANIKIRTSFNALSSETHFRVPNTEGVPPQEERKGMDKPITVLATFQPGGVISDVEGLSALYPEQQRVWRNWAAAFVLTTEARKPTKEWTALADVPASLSVTDGLKWKRKLAPAGEGTCSTYSLGTGREPAKSSALPGGCTKIIVRERLVQPSPGAAAAQELDRQRDLHKSGTARGKGEVRAQVSKETECLVKSETESEQSANIHFAKADRSDSIECNSSTKTRTEIRLITDTLLASTGSATKL